MRKLSYLAILEPSTDGFGVYFPDLPGCISFGTTIEDARNNATEALELHIYGMEKDSDILPEPSKSFPLEELSSDNIIVSITIFPDVVRNEMDNKRVKTNVTIPAWLKEIAEERGVNYSRLLETALIEYLGVKRIY